MIEYVLDTTERFDGALAAAAEAHRNELHALRMAVTVLTLAIDGNLTEEASEALRIAKLYANVMITEGVAVSDTVAVLSEGLKGQYVTA